MIRIGIDLGGTNIAVGAVDDGHAIVSRVSVPTLARRPAAELSLIHISEPTRPY